MTDRGGTAMDGLSALSAGESIADTYARYEVM